MKIRNRQHFLMVLILSSSAPLAWSQNTNTLGDGTHGFAPPPDRSKVMGDFTHGGPARSQAPLDWFSEGLDNRPLGSSVEPYQLALMDRLDEISTLMDAGKGEKPRISWVELGIWTDPRESSTAGFDIFFDAGNLRWEQRFDPLTTFLGFPLAYSGHGQIFLNEIEIKKLQSEWDGDYRNKFPKVARAAIVLHLLEQLQLKFPEADLKTLRVERLLDLATSDPFNRDEFRSQLRRIADKSNFDNRQESR